MRTTDLTVDLDGSQHAELIGSLQMARDALRSRGLTGDGCQTVLDSIYSITQPGTAGLRMTELVHGDDAGPGPVRYALVSEDAGKQETVAAYLPDNYTIVGRTAIRHTNTVQFLIAGRDVAGWTLDDYVIPRLASGMYYAEEVA
jgi:hypothetical protein